MKAEPAEGGCGRKPAPRERNGGSGKLLGDNILYRLVKETTKDEYEACPTSSFRMLVLARLWFASANVLETSGVPFECGAGYRFEVAGIGQIPVYV